MDKNPRQITRLRVEDQKRLEELATEVVYNKDTNTTEIGTNLYVDGKTKLNCLEVLNTDRLEDGITFNNGDRNVMHIGFDGDTIIYFETINEAGEYTDDVVTLTVNAGKGGQNILTNDNVKSLFGNQSIFGSGNIDLYRHQLEAKDANDNYIYFNIISSNSLTIDSLQDLTTVTKATAKYQENCLIQLASNALLNGTLVYVNNVWKAMSYDASSDEDLEFIITTITDVVTTI